MKSGGAGEPASGTENTNNAKSTEKEVAQDDDEVDPLDVYMDQIK